MGEDLWGSMVHTLQARKELTSNLLPSFASSLEQIKHSGEKYCQRCPAQSELICALLVSYQFGSLAQTRWLVLNENSRVAWFEIC